MNDQPFWTNQLNPETFNQVQIERLQRAQQAIDRLLTAEGKRTVENTLIPYDEAMNYLDSAGSETSLMQEIHPDESFRSAAEKLSQSVSALATDLSLNRQIFDALSAIELTESDEPTRHYLERTLRDFRLAGVDQDTVTREKIKALRDELVLIGQDFARNIRDDQARIIIDSVAELDGLPQDFIENHPAGADGKITLTTDHVDYVPVMSYAKSEDLRKRMYFAYNNRAFPENMEVLDRLAAKRYELANLLGYENWAQYVTADKMIKSAGNASQFIDRIVEASTQRSQSEYQELLRQKQRDFPEATEINAWESGYYSELLRKTDYSFDSQSVRPYFPYQRVKNGVLEVTGKLFGVTFKQIEKAPVWHESVECWEMFENETLAGRFYLDMHPRDGKFNHAAMFFVRTGIAERQLPEAALVCNFPKDDGLMEFGEVRTFFHEFGHLLHYLFGGRQKWLGIGGIRTEWDFVEAPSQLLEEWVEQASILQTFAKHYQRDEPIPTELVERMMRAVNFGKGLAVRRQMVFARISLSLYDRKPEFLDTDKLVKQVSQQYSPFPTVEGTHFQTAFGHLDGYSAIYYTYMWSLVLAKDIFSRFDRSNLLAAEIAKEYRRTVLEPGGSKPADELVENFLGRQSDFRAWQKWLND